MMRNEAGFSFPLTFMLLLLFSIFVIYSAEQYVTEKRIFSTTEIILQQEYYMASAVKKVEQSLRSDPTIAHGQFFYQHGDISFVVTEIDEQLSLITFTGRLVTEQEWKGRGYYDKVNQKVIKWIENR